MLLLHGNGASRAQVAENAGWLARQGYAVMAIDFRGHGQSTLVPHSFGLFESRDAAVALDWLRHQQQGARIAAIGISLGGAAALLGDQGPLPADALILQAVYPDIRRAIRNRIAASLGTVPSWLVEPALSFQALPRYGVWPGRIAPLTALRAYHGPVFVIGGGADRFTPPSETREMFARRIRAAGVVAGRWARSCQRLGAGHAALSRKNPRLPLGFDRQALSAVVRLCRPARAGRDAAWPHPKSFRPPSPR